MKFNDYQNWTEETVKYPTTTRQEAISYCALGLNGEAGEVAEKIKKWLRDGLLSEYEVALELGDVLYYLARLAQHIDYTLEDIVELNVEKLEKRLAEGKIQGSGDNR